MAYLAREGSPIIFPLLLELQNFISGLLHLVSDLFKFEALLC